MNLKNWLLKEQFNPSIFGILVNPFYFGRKSLYKNIKFKSGYITGRILDIGCGSKPYEKLFNTSQYIGIDVKSSGHYHENSRVDLFYDGKKIPFEENYFDSVVCFEVLEVIFDPDSFLNEIKRVLRPGGKALFTVPFIWDEHEQPFDYARYSSFGLKHLFERNGFSVKKNDKYLTDLRLLSLLTNAYIYKIIKKIIPSSISFPLILPFSFVVNITGLLLSLFPENKDMYFGNIILVEKANVQ